MRRCIVPALAIVIGLSLSFSSAVGGGIPAKTLKEVKAASCYVKVNFGLPIPGTKTLPGTGSGFLIRSEGETGYVVTNHHVVSPPKEIPGLVRVGDVTLVFNSGTPGENILKAEVVASDPIRDLAILKIKDMKDLPRPIVLDPRVELVETMTVYAFGFPFGGALATGKLNPAITVTKGTISSIRNDDAGKIRLVQIDAEINPGNSGGPVVDEKGNLVGVAVSKIDKSRIGFAIPTYPITDMMIGKVSGVTFDTVKVERSSVDIQLEAALLDPLGKVTDVAIHYAPSKAVKETPKADKDGIYPLLKGATKVGLDVDKGKATGRFTYESRSKVKGKESLTYQAVYVNGEGKTIISAPATAQIDFTQVIFSDKLAVDDPIDKVRKQPSKTFEFRMQRGKHYVVEMRGDPKDLDPWLRIEDSRGANLAEDDDSGGVLNSLIVFSPTADDVYRIVATVLRGTGSFSVRIREEEGESAKSFRKKASLSPTDPLDRLLQAPAQTYNVILKRGIRYTIDMKSKDFDTFLRLENMAGVNLAADDDSGGELNSRIVFTPGQDSIFRIVATSFDRNTGEYELSIKEGGAMEVGPEGLKIAAMLNAGDPLDPLLGKKTNSRSKMYEIKLEAGSRYQIDLISNQFDPVLRIEDSKGKQLALDDDGGGGLNSRLVFQPPTTDVYRVYAVTLDGALGQFGLVIRRAK